MTARPPYRPRDIAFSIISCLILAVSTVHGQDPVPSFAPTGTGPSYPESSNGTMTEVPSLEAFYLDGMEIEMDGVLDDPAWDLAQTGWGFQQMDPERSATSNATARPAAGTGTTISTPASPSAWSQATP